MTNCMKLKVSMTIDTRLGSLLDKRVVDIKTYKIVIGSLLYLTASRHDIMFYVCTCVRYQENLGEPHLTVVKNIFFFIFMV